MLVLKTGTGPTPCRPPLVALILFAWPLVAAAVDGTSPAIDPQQEGWPWYRGHMYFRGQNRLYCYDMRAQR